MQVQPHGIPRFKSEQDWVNFIQSNPQIDGNDLSIYRQNCYHEIEAIRGRPLLIYFVKMDAPQGAPISIEASDVDGFTDMVNSLRGVDAVDVLIHSPGGSPDATERIVSILRGAFTEVHFLVPHSAYSAATMLALSGNTITMHSSATLGPIDPQLNGVPARTITKGFERVRDLLKDEGAAALPAYVPLLDKYNLHLLELCADAESLSRLLVKEWLSKYMLGGKEIPEEEIDNIVNFFADYENHLTHARPLVFSKISGFGLPIEQANIELCELLWEAYISINGFLKATPLVKLFENTVGISFGRQFQQIQLPIQMQFGQLPGMPQ